MRDAARFMYTQLNKDADISQIMALSPNDIKKYYEKFRDAYMVQDKNGNWLRRVKKWEKKDNKLWTPKQL